MFSPFSLCVLMCQPRCHEADAAAHNHSPNESFSFYNLLENPLFFYRAWNKWPQSSNDFTCLLNTLTFTFCFIYSKEITFNKKVKKEIEKGNSFHIDTEKKEIFLHKNIQKSDLSSYSSLYNHIDFSTWEDSFQFAHQSGSYFLPNTDNVPYFLLIISCLSVFFQFRAATDLAFKVQISEPGLFFITYCKFPRVWL